MPFGLDALNPYLAALAIVLAAFAAGGLVDFGILARLRAVAPRMRWRGVSVVANSLRGAITAWSVIAAGYFAAVSLGVHGIALGWVHRSANLLAILVGTWVVSRFTAGMVRLYVDRDDTRLPSSTLLVNVAVAIVGILGSLIALQALGVSVTPILTGLGVGGIAVALALQDTLSNLFAGIQLLASRQVKPGDYIRLETGEEGYVMDVNWRITTMRTLPDNLVVVPNAKLAQSIVTNFAEPGAEMSVPVEIVLAQDADLDAAERILADAAVEVMREVEGGVPEWEPKVRVVRASETGVALGVGLRVTEYTQQFLVRHEFLKRAHRRLLEEGVSLPSARPVALPAQPPKP